MPKGTVLGAGDSDIGNVDVESLPELPAGDEVIGKTDVIARSQVAADTATSAANAAAVITYAATASLRHIISGIVASYAGTTPVGTLTIQDVSGTTVFICDVGADPLVLVFPEPIKAAAVNTAMIITLSAGGSGVVGHLNVLGHRTAA